ncbi:Anhydro-N-acetylmuramic acid kinase [Candidatus Filomicrobium marinum]|uniref:Anhydro-N-acetylmuramic acid kinase n=1 Tax=Candidatus Filomicrobium marinum TaxID=1608628 RepID=A0A0D6J9Z3_9HYPH|nr:Anhydro-N-acetylmuramic acid kinase [Candidatus Filomicrobium marinum]CPR15314.1 Anhydro-N-acetylmuramic acid kinase [Candidatus Filomicrobium marinum]
MRDHAQEGAIGQGDMREMIRALGLMSGTSMDGIDVAMIETDGERVVRSGASMTFDYSPEMRERLATGIDQARSINGRCERPGLLADIERELTELHASAVSAFLRKSCLVRSDIDVIGFHGQTVLHRPEDHLTVQIGDGALLAKLTHRPVVYDLRARDMELGGQGAPLAPVYHRALLAELAPRPAVVVNIGGVGNVTWISAQGDLIAFDTGPGNALIDDWVRAKAGRACDIGGALAAQGRVDEAAVAQFCMYPYLELSAPKSLDRNTFSLDVVAGMSIEDGAATLTAITAETIARARSLMPEAPLAWIISGGGRKNPTLMAMLQERLPGEVLSAEVAGLNGDSVEAEAWAFMAVRSLKGLPITFPGTTGVRFPASGGVLVDPASI